MRGLKTNEGGEGGEGSYYLSRLPFPHSTKFSRPNPPRFLTSRWPPGDRTKILQRSPNANLRYEDYQKLESPKIISILYKDRFQNKTIFKYNLTIN